MENDEVLLKLFETRAIIIIANIKLNLDNILVLVPVGCFNMILVKNFITEI